YPTGTALWVITSGEPRGGGAMRNNINWTAVARLAEGVAASQVERELSGIARRIQESEPESDYSYGVRVVDLRETMVSGAQDELRLLLGAVAFVLLIACGNLAALNLARGLRRRGEFALRLALGAGRRRLLLQ